MLGHPQTSVRLLPLRRSQRILDFETIWSELQKPSQTAAMRGEAELCIYNLKKTSPHQSWSQVVVCVSTPRMYLPSGYFLVYMKFISMSFGYNISADIPKTTPKTGTASSFMAVPSSFIPTLALTSLTIMQFPVLILNTIDA